MTKIGLLAILFVSTAQAGVTLKSFHVERVTPKAPSSEKMITAKSMVSATNVIITRRNGANITIQKGTVNALSIGDKIVQLDYTPDEIFANGFER